MRVLPALVVVALVCASSARADTGSFSSLLPVGQGQTVNALELGALTASGQPPASFVNQRGMFNALLPVADVPDDELGRYFKPAPLDPPQSPASVIAPRAGVSIARDAYNVPYITGTTREATMWGAGYAGSQDRLFFMDVLRRTAQARLTSFIGPGVDDVNLKADAAQAAVTDYDDGELARQLEELATASPAGAQVKQDIVAYTAGVNAYIATARTAPGLMPSEYAAIGQPLEDWRTIDSASILGLLNGYYGLGGGSELLDAQVLSALQKRFGSVKKARRVFEDFRRRDDPEAPVVVTKRFPFDAPGVTDQRSVALPDEGSIKLDSHVEDRSGGPPAPAGSRSAGSVLTDGLRLKRHASNAMVIGAKQAVGGHPIMVAGPQVGFYAPSILDEVVLRGPGIAVRGGVVPGVGIYPIAGRGPDYAWSVTTAQGDNTDIFAERLCEADGGKPTTSSSSYVYKGRCLPLRVQRRPLAWTPGPLDVAADPAAAPFTAKLRIDRSVHGPIIARGEVRGLPVAFSRARASYFHEGGAAEGLSLLAAGNVGGPQDFQRRIARVTGSYNWFYADADHTAYVQSGLYARRHKGVSTDLPSWGDGSWDWRGFDPATYTARTIPFSGLPKGIDPARGYLVSWNNKQAPGWRASDADWEYGPVHRSQRLERRVRVLLRTGDRKIGVGELAGAMGDAGTVDLRGQEVLPYLLRVIDRGPVPAALGPAVDALRRWEASGAHRRDGDGDGNYDDAAAVALMDAWWRPLVKAIYAPIIGQPATDRIDAINRIDYLPKDGPDTFFYGWYSYVVKDLRTLIKRPVKGKLSRSYCGRGKLAACRSALLSTLEAAAGKVGDPARVRIPSTCPETSPPSCDQLVFTAAGAATVPPLPWQDRGTYQQVVQVGGPSRATP